MASVDVVSLAPAKFDKSQFSSQRMWKGQAVVTCTGGVGSDVLLVV